MKDKKYLDLLKRSVDRGKQLPKQKPSYIQEGEDYYNAALIYKTYPKFCSIENPENDSVMVANNLSDLKKLESLSEHLFVLVPDNEEIRSYYKSNKLGDNITLSYCQDVNHAFTTIRDKIKKIESTKKE